MSGATLGEARLRAAAQAYAAGATLAALARDTGVGYGRLRRALAGAGIALRPRGSPSPLHALTDAQRAALLADLAGPEPLAALCARWGLGRRTLLRLHARAGLPPRRRARRALPAVPVPAWTPPALAARYRAIARARGEEEAAAWARARKRGALREPPEARP